MAKLLHVLLVFCVLSFGTPPLTSYQYCLFVFLILIFHAANAKFYDADFENVTDNPFVSYSTPQVLMEVVPGGSMYHSLTSSHL